MHSSVVVEVYEQGEPESALQALSARLRDHLPLRCAFWVDAAERSVRASWPAPIDPSRELLEAVTHTLRPEVYPLGSEFPAEASSYPDAHMLVLPLGEEHGTVVLVAERGSFGEELEPWQPLTIALRRVAERQRRLRTSQKECEQLRRRVEEAEALHTLGLAVNRTLDPDEVLNLVARFTRTLLGAHYVTVNTTESGWTHAVASVGLRGAAAEKEDYLLARRVVEAGKPLTVGENGADFRVEEFPFHALEEMRVGLGIPLSLFGNTFGALIVGYRRPYTLTTRDTRLGLTLAGHAAVAISNARLHHQVELRSQELAAAYEELREVTSAKERFFNHISHDLRTPIGAVKGYNELLLDGVAGELPPQANRYLENSQRAAESLLDLIGDVMDFAKLEAGRIELEPRSCDLADIVEDALAAVRPQAEEKGLALEVKVADDLPPLHTDPDRVRQILVNLLSNAVKFTPEGSVAIIAAQNDDDTARELRVSDSGPGIPPDDLDRIFEEFEQVKGTKGGTGLGLPIARKLARLLGGDLRAESEPGVGSTF
ncbi:MAG: ATP-binding protein, partial [Longimicrobiaceae bacterium]